MVFHPTIVLRTRIAPSRKTIASIISKLRPEPFGLQCVNWPATGFSAAMSFSEVDLNRRKKSLVGPKPTRLLICVS